MIKVSVIIPVYNTEEYLKECLDSVINQTLKDIEIICIDDGSTDNSSEILEEYAQKDFRIKVIKQINSGAGKARNQGIEIAQGKYIYFLDSDDYLKLNALEVLTTNIKNSEICVCKALYEDNSVISHSLNIKKLSNYKTISSKNNPDIIFEFCLPALFIKLYKTDFIKTNQIECQQTKVCNDIFFNYATLGLADSISYVNEALVIHRKNRINSLTSSRGNYPECIFEAFNSLKLLFKSKNILKNFEKPFYKCAKKRFEYEFKFCHPSYINSFYKEAKNFILESKLIPKIFKYENDNIRKHFTILGIKFNLKALNSPPPRNLDILLKNWFLKKTGKYLNLNNPKTFNEKIQWLKLYDSTPLKTRLADKYLVREWIKEKIGEEYLIPLLGVWDKFDDIDFDKLPNQFVLKCNHGCGYNIIIKDKSQLNIKDTRKKINKWMKENYAYKAGFELHYSNIPRKIIAEAYIEDSNKKLNDYKIMCFNGKPQYIWIDQGRFTDRTENIYNTKWELQPFLLTYPNSKEQIPPPENLAKMFELAEILAENFCLVRVDFYNIDGKIYFGEMTFTSASGIDKFIPSSYNRVWGDMIELPKLSKPKLIVSLTSFPYRIPTVYLTIKSLLHQTMKPDKIILQLSEDEFPNKEGDLPENLLNLREKGLIISWNKGNIRSYKKLIPTLKQYPNDIIITVDDDFIYDKNLIKLLWKAYEKNPKLIHCHRTTKFSLRKNGEFKVKGVKWYKKPSFGNKLVGCGGVLYPPHVLYKDITDENLFTSLAPTNDDIWFWLMAVMNDTKINIIDKNIPRPKEINETKNGPCLTKINDHGENLFDKDLERVLNHYKGLREKLISDIK